MFGLGWVLGTGAVGGLLGSIAIGLSGLIVWGLSGIAVGAVQWALVCRRLRVSAIRWITATAFGSFLAMCAHFYLGLLDTKIWSWNGVLRDSVIVAIIGGLALGIPQAAVLRDLLIRWWVWLLATMLGVLAAWLGDLALWSPAYGHVPRQVGMIIHTGGYWIALSLPQAFVIGIHRGARRQP